MRIMNNKNLMMIYLVLLIITFGIVTIQLINIVDNQKDLASVVFFFWVPIYILQFSFYSVSGFSVVRILLSLKESCFEKKSCLMSRLKLLLVVPQIIYLFINSVVIILFLIMRNTIVLRILLGYPYLYMSLFLFICSIYIYRNLNRT